MKIKRKYSWLIVLTLLISISGKAQVDYRSPYSRYGIGDLTKTNHPVQMSMGGISMALRDHNLINSENPASYTAFDTLSFVFDGGAAEKISTWETLSMSEQTEYSSLGYLNIGFPITKWLKTSFGLKPVSNVGYSIYYDAPQDNSVSDNFGATQIFEGTGGLNDFYIGVGAQVTERLSLGVNASYTWGEINLKKYSTFPDSNYYWDTRVTNRRNISDIRLSYGLQYQIPLPSDWQLTTGLTYSNLSALEAKEENLTTMLIRRESGAERVLDTIKHTKGSSGNIKIPESLGAGIVLEKTNRLRLGLDYRFQKWEDFESFGKSDSLSNSSYIAFGAEIWPEHNTLSSYFRKIKYRFGAHYNNTYHQIRGRQLSEIGISFGVGLPIKNSQSSINLGVEIGQRGTTDNDLIEENYVKFTLGLAIFERWFLQRKYQ
ncbi:MAG: hypothetical protein K9J27_08930 [Bacteroidales bacterium]|nr:hypothetical protein [Bacteroidales bacterium]MCF8333511.1 hypothetical protein [Bacteroidales bacterium]